jgi:hypothetical protein
LGYATQSQFADDVGADPVTVWAYTANGQRVSVDDAKSGGGQGLHCVCGSGLIAAKGEVYVHHFRHENGAICQAAYAAALRAFLLETFEAANSVKLPAFQSKIGWASIATASEVNHETVALFDLRAGDGRRLLVAATTKKQSLEEVGVLAKAEDVSAIAIDLRRFRSMPDPAIRVAIIDQAPRAWLHLRGRSLPAAKAKASVPPPEPLDLSEIKRRLFPDLFG